MTNEELTRLIEPQIEALGYAAKYLAEDGVREVCEALESGKVDKTTETLTLEWYKELHKWHDLIRQLELYGGMLHLPDPVPVNEPLPSESIELRHDDKSLFSSVK